MPARDPVARALRRAEDWIFRPGSARRLAAVRIGLCLVLAARLSRPLYLQIAGQPRALYRPISFMHLFSSMPSAGVVLPVQVVAVAACLLAAAGLAVRITLPLAFAGALFLNGMWSSVGQPMHNETLLLLALFPLLFARTPRVWSANSRRGAPETSVHYGWPVRTGMIVVAAGYFFTGVYKLVFSGPAWVTSDNLRWVMYGISAEHRHAIGPAIFLASHPVLSHLAAAATLLVELGFPLCLWKPRAAWFFVPAAVLMHVGIGLTMQLDYSAWALTVLVLFVPWDALADRWRARRSHVGVLAPAASGVPVLAVTPSERMED
jgi:hypothetical protein